MHETKHPPRVDATARRLAPRAPARAHTPRARAPRSRSRSLPWMARDTARAATSPIPRVVRVARAYIHIYIYALHTYTYRVVVVVFALMETLPKAADRVVNALIVCVSRARVRATAIARGRVVEGSRSVGRGTPCVRMVITHHPHTHTHPHP